MAFKFIQRFKEVLRHSTLRSIEGSVERGKFQDRAGFDDDRQQLSLREYELYYWSSVPAPWY
ncbi:MAG: hypothetical protein KGI75_32260 [Rhizobiaceae bacterium]|nr:hypothetical protein [Rhizobiaceae bacterium]